MSRRWHSPAALIAMRNSWAGSLMSMVSCHLRPPLRKSIPRTSRFDTRWKMAPRHRACDLSEVVEDYSGGALLLSKHGAGSPPRLGRRFSCSRRLVCRRVRQRLPPHWPVYQSVSLIPPAQGCRPGDENLAVVVRDENAPVHRRRLNWIPMHRRALRAICVKSYGTALRATERPK